MILSHRFLSPTLKQLSTFFIISHWLRYEQLLLELIIIHLWKINFVQKHSNKIWRRITCVICLRKQPNSLHYIYYKQKAKNMWSSYWLNVCYLNSTLSICFITSVQYGIFYENCVLLKKKVIIQNWNILDWINFNPLKIQTMFNLFYP